MFLEVKMPSAKSSIMIGDYRQGQMNNGRFALFQAMGSHYRYLSREMTYKDK